MFCHYYGLLGHDIKHSASHFAALKNGREVVYPYDDWMKAVRPRLWLPTRWNLSHYTPSSRMGGMENTNSSDFSRLQASATVVANATMARADDKYEKKRPPNLELFWIFRKLMPRERQRMKLMQTF